MTERSAKLSSSLSHEDQLELLKDSIDLRFTSPEINEFAPVQGETAPYIPRPYKPRPYKANRQDHKRLPIVTTLTTFSGVAEYVSFKRQLRYICTAIILIGVFTPFINIVSAAETFTGIELMSGLWEIFELNLLPAALVTGVAIFPIMLCLYSAAIIINPFALIFSKNFLKQLWSITATSGILYFFAAFMFITLEGQTTQTLTNTIGVGYYVTMITIFVYHFLAQWADQKMVS